MAVHDRMSILDEVDCLLRRVGAEDEKTRDGNKRIGMNTDNLGTILVTIVVGYGCIEFMVLLCDVLYGQMESSDMAENVGRAVESE